MVLRSDKVQGAGGFSMILEKETFEIYGYYPRELSLKSNKRVIVLCPRCNKQYHLSKCNFFYKKTPVCKSCANQSKEKSTTFRNTIKNKEVKDRAILDEQISKRVLFDKTIDKFGYSPYDLTFGSKQLVIIRCLNDGCENEREVLMSDFYRKTSEICRECYQKNVTYTDEQKRESLKIQWRNTSRKKYSTLRGKMIRNISTVLCRVLRTHGISRGIFRHLPYDRNQFFNHIMSELERYNWICPLCKNFDLHEAYNIEHRQPLSTAKTVEEIIKLFELSNLSVMCPNCNQHIKRDKFLEY
jgi:hypothetical protein